jgi:hypothetical protein
MSSEPLLTEEAMQRLRYGTELAAVREALMKPQLTAEMRQRLGLLEMKLKYGGMFRPLEPAFLTDEEWGLVGRTPPN